MKKNKIQYFLLVIGILLFSSNSVLSRYFELSDSTSGLLIGLGIGILIASLISIIKNKRNQNVS